MTLSEVAEAVAQRVGAKPDLVWGFLQESIQVIVEALDRGESVKIRGVGTLSWEPVRETTRRSLHEPGVIVVRGGWKLHFAPAAKFKGRRDEQQRRQS